MKQSSKKMSFNSNAPKNNSQSPSVETKWDEKYHTPALLKETIDGLNLKPDGIYVDATFGAGGHSREILQHLGEKGHLFGLDQDLDVLQNIPTDTRFTFVRGNFGFMKNFLKYYGISKVDGVLADLGVSSHHFDVEERGFSFRFDTKLDMRMNTKSKLTAEDIINSYTEEQLADVFFRYGELHHARKIAKTIVKSRTQKPIVGTSQFLEVLKPFLTREKEKKDMARVFQALRIEVNNELEMLKKLLVSSLEMLQTGGRIAVITYHSLEDRLVKNFFRSGNFEGRVEKDFYGNVILPLRQINRKVIEASEHEITKNPRARSAKLRIAEKI